MWAGEDCRAPASGGGAERALPPRVEDRARDEPSALVALLRWLVAEGEADEALAPAVGEERGPRRVLRLRRHRERFEPRGVGCRREPDPDEEPSLGTADLHVDALEHLPESAEHGVTLGAIDTDQVFHVRFPVVAQIPGRHALHVRAHAAAEVEALEGGQHPARRAEPA